MSDSVEIPIYGRSGVVTFAAIDAGDAGLVSEKRWRLNSYGYAVTYKPRNGAFVGAIFMHRMIMAAPAGMFVDHINHNPLDNRKSNLRVCTPQENSCNRAPNSTRLLPKGVSFKRNGYEANIRSRGVLHYLGRFKTVEAAEAKYLEAARHHFGAFIYNAGVKP